MQLSVWDDFKQHHSGQILVNTPAPKLVELAVSHDEGILTSTGALATFTGKYTGRSPNDKYIVDTPDVHADIWWDNTKKMSEMTFNNLYQKVLSYLQAKDVYVFKGYAGADSSHSLAITVINEYARQNLFIQQLLIRPEDSGWPMPETADFTIIAAPGCTADPAVDQTNSEAFIVINFQKKVILIGGTHYAGEIKKSVFSIVNYLLPKKRILSMHCSANKGPNNDVALFFGLSGTGKTSLSADVDRFLIGDDEHGWSDNGVFNVEGGCYAKCINLSHENEPQIWDAIKFGSILENVVVDPATRVADYDDAKFTENTRAAYPISSIPRSIYPGSGPHPSTIIFLTADAFGVLPPIAKLDPNQAMYYFLSGYTSKLAGTERGITEPQATFSSCFGAPFLPLPPETYAELLKEKISRHNTRVFLINTGWQGGAYGVGKRISIQYTRRMVSAAIDGYLDFVDYVVHPIFNLSIPVKCPGVPDAVLQPQNTWTDRAAYDESAKRLSQLFHANFAKFTSLPPEVAASGPFLLDKIKVS